METHITSNMDRRDFLGAAATALLATAAVQILGCNSSDGYGSNPSPTGSLSGVVAAPNTDNHGHVANLSQAQADAGAALTMDIMGTANHSHTIALTAQDVADIKANRKVVKTASAEIGHYHTVTFN